jgi:hypothetical protein
MLIAVQLVQKFPALYGTTLPYPEQPTTGPHPEAHVSVHTLRPLFPHIQRLKQENNNDIDVYQLMVTPFDDLA